MNHSRIMASVAALAVAALVGLSACGGGSDGLSRADEEKLQMEAAAAEEARKAAEAKAEEDVAAANRLAEQARMDKEAADAAAMRAAAARDAAIAEQTKAERARLAAETELAAVRQQLTAAQRTAEVARLEAERARQAAEAEAKRQIEQAKQEAEQQADVAVRAPLLIAELTGDTVDDAGNVMGVTHRRGESRTFTRPNNLPAKGSAPRVPGSWSSASYSGPRGAVGTDTVYLYTNIQAPSSKAFWKVHGESVGSITSTPTPAVTVSGFGTTAKELYPGTDGTPDQTGTTSGADQGRSIGGTYDGYSGTFKCDANCDIEAVQGGALTFHGTWTFTASLTAKKSSRHAEQDSEFLYFGIWAFEPTVATGAPDFKWAHGGDSNDTAADADIGNFANLTGEATFTGGAIGKYALAKVGGRAAKIGTFTATANFTADFTADTLSGRITDFKEGGSSLGADWHVFLGSSSSAAASLANTGATGTLEAHGEIDGDTAIGAWAATLHGSDNPGASSLHTADPAKYPASRYPVADVAGVSGWFNAAAGTNAAVAGAFGAACTTGTMCAK
ncbi:MAG: hypothetical protein OXU67_14425 [Chloroflexota bacterium]|nr:hypothetical protein [Chloroflexota bacterium]